MFSRCLSTVCTFKSRFLDGNNDSFVNNLKRIYIDHTRLPFQGKGFSTSNLFQRRIGNSRFEVLNIQFECKGDIAEAVERSRRSTAKMGSSDASVTMPNPASATPELFESLLPTMRQTPMPSASTRGKKTGPVVTAPQSQAKPMLNHTLMSCSTTFFRK